MSIYAPSSSNYHDLVIHNPEGLGIIVLNQILYTPSHEFMTISTLDFLDNGGVAETSKDIRKTLDVVFGPLI